MCILDKFLADYNCKEKLTIYLLSGIRLDELELKDYDETFILVKGIRSTMLIPITSIASMTGKDHVS